MLGSVMGSYAYDETKRMNSCILNEISFFKCFIQIWKSYVKEKIDMIERIRILLAETIEAKNKVEKIILEGLGGGSIKIKEAIEKHENRERYFENSIKMAKLEIERFQNDRLNDMKDYITSYVERQIKISRETEYVISGSILRINLISLNCMEKKAIIPNVNASLPTISLPKLERSSSKSKSFSGPSSVGSNI